MLGEPGLCRIVLAQPPPAPSTSPYEKPPQATKPLKSASVARPSIRSVMCTSTAANPARWNAYAISVWLLTPCSRRIAMRGRAPRGDERRGDVRRTGRRSAPSTGRDRPRSLAARVLLVGAVRVVAQARDPPRRLAPGLLQFGARPREHRLRIAPELDDVLRVRLADDLARRAESRRRAARPSPRSCRPRGSAAPRRVPRRTAPSGSARCGGHRPARAGSCSRPSRPRPGRPPARRG